MSPEELAGPDRARQLFGAEVVDADGAKVGTVTEVFLDDDTDQPKWVSVRTGWFGTNESLVPLQGAGIGDGRIQVQYDKATIKAAPRSDDGQPLSRDDEGQVYRHYHGETSGRHSVTGDASVDRSVGTAGDRLTTGRDSEGELGDRVAPDGKSGDAHMVRSQERLTAGTERVATGRARMRRFLVRQEQQITVSVAREDVRVEYVTDIDPAMMDAGGRGVWADDSSPGADQPQHVEADHQPYRQDDRTVGGENAAGREGWMVLYAQRPVVTMEWVPVERVRLSTVAVTAEETVTGEVRKEQLDVVSDDVPDADSDRVTDHHSDRVAESASRERQVR